MGPLATVARPVFRPCSQLSYVNAPSTMTSVRGVSSPNAWVRHPQSLPPLIARRKPVFSSAFHSLKAPAPAGSKGIRSTERKPSEPRVAWTTTSHGTQQPPGGIGNEPSAGQYSPWAMPTTARGWRRAQSATGKPDDGVAKISSEKRSESRPSNSRCPVVAAGKCDTSRS